MPLRIVSIEDGKTLKAFNHLLTRSKKVDFIEQFNEKLLVKQEGENLHIVDVHTHAVRLPSAPPRALPSPPSPCRRASWQVTVVSKTEFVTPSAFVFLYENNLFLTFRQRQVTVWNFRGEAVVHFEDHTLWHPETNTNTFFITAAQDYIVSYCRPQSGGGGGRGSVHISHILTGKCVARLDSPPDAEAADAASADVDASEPGSSADVPSRPRDGGFGDVTALYFSEERNELYVGNKQGILHVWSQ